MSGQTNRISEDLNEQLLAKVDLRQKTLSRVDEMLRMNGCPRSKWDSYHHNVLHIVWAVDDFCYIHLCELAAADNDELRRIILKRRDETERT